VLPVWFCNDESLAEAPDLWRKGLPEAVRADWRMYLAWMRLAARGYGKDDTGRRVVEVVLKTRYIPTPKPGEPREWTGPVTERPVARWKTESPPPPGRLPLDGYDPVGKQFVPLDVWGSP
jgi:hypothetical protein